MSPDAAGWNDFFMEQYARYEDSGLVPGRVTGHEGSAYMVETAVGGLECIVAGHFSYIATSRSDYPAIGDWVLLREAAGVNVIERVLERKSRFSRRTAGRRSDEQIIAANIDMMFITASLDGGRNFNLRGIERYMVMVQDGGAEPVLVLNKCDLCSDVHAAIQGASSISCGAAVLAVSALTGEGMERLRFMIAPGMTAAFTGPSGVGKSALVNYLLGRELQRTGGQRMDDLRGRHTTSSGGLFFLEAGGMVIDTPGLRELKPYGDLSSLDLAFPEIGEASERCRFRDCTHVDEPGCAVRGMLLSGSLEQGRYRNYISMREEMEALDGLKSEKGRLERKAKDKALSKLLKDYNKNHR